MDEIYVYILTFVYDPFLGLGEQILLAQMLPNYYCQES